MARRLRAIGSLGIVLLLVSVPSAEAKVPAEFGHGAKVATGKWGPLHCRHGLSIRWEWMGDMTLGVAYRFERRCYIAVSPIVANDRRATCTVIVHEWGHLAGHGHTHDATDVMDSTFTGYVKRC